MRSRELDRAKHIQQWLARLDERKREDVSKQLKGAPAQLMDNGLLQTLAFLRSKGNEHALVADGIRQWLEECRLIKGADTITTLAGLDAAEYRRCTEEAIAWLNWAKRLALAKVAMAGGRS